MKFHLQLLTLLLSILFSALSCKNDTAEEKNKETDKHLEVKQSIDTLIDSIAKKKKLPKRKNYEYVIAESGLNYRDSPNGKVLGKLAWRDKVEYLFDTEHTQKIIDNYREIEGNWAAIKHKTDTVFVFNNYLSYEEPRYSRQKLYYAEAYAKYTLKPSNELDIRQAFVNVSESFYMPENFIDKKDLRKDTITFNKIKRAEFLKRMNYSNRDTIFIYDIASGLIKKHVIKETPIVAFINIYSYDSSTEKGYHQEEYQIGFNLGKTNYGGFAVIGKENPFIEKGLEQLVFKEMTEKTINENIKNKLIPKDWKKDYSPETYYMYQYEDIRFFVKVLKGSNNGYYNSWSDLICMNVNTKENYSITQSGGELSSHAPLRLEGEKIEDNYSSQYIGKLFKNKPPVTFGYSYGGFGCELIDFLDKEELPIVILCDNRH